MTGSHKYHYTLLSLEDLELQYNNGNDELQWQSPFVLPFWLKSWTEFLLDDCIPLLLSIWQKTTLLGIAPLCRKGSIITFMGSEDVCDFQDMIIVTGMESLFFDGLLSYFSKNNCEEILFGSLLPSSSLMRFLPESVKKTQYIIKTEPAGMLHETSLPANWDKYLESLAAKHRHEFKRKRRRLSEKGNIGYDSVTGGTKLDSALELFFEMFCDSRPEKRIFLTRGRRDYFSRLARELAAREMLHLGQLKLDGKVVAMVFCFYWHNTLYLYNNGYHDTYSSASVGIISKALSIREAVVQNCQRYNFLKGDERYKKHLGGKEIPLSRMSLRLEK